MIDPNRVQAVLPPPVGARHSEYSMVFSADDEAGKPTDRLLAVAIDAAEHARKISLERLHERMSSPPYFPDVWPGEHYRFLAGLVLVLQPQQIVEIGTGTGLSALAMQSVAQSGCKITTFDTVPWNRTPQTCLRDSDFRSGQLTQHSSDLSDPLIFSAHVDDLRRADIIFIDAAKDGKSEERLLKNFSTLRFLKTPIVVFDDIKLWAMLRIWREISRPKLDVTSFGHWSGTGLVEWS